MRKLFKIAKQCGAQYGHQNPSTRNVVVISRDGLEAFAKAIAEQSLNSRWISVDDADCVTVSRCYISASEVEEIDAAMKGES